MPQIQVTSNQPATQLIRAGDGTTLIVNTDQAVTVYLGDSNQLTPGDPSNTAPLGPQANVTMDGSRDVFAICSLGKSVNLNVIPSGVLLFNPS